VTLIDRGLFVLLTGHFLLNLDDLQSVELEQWIFGRVTVTDAIGICLMCAVALYRLRAGVLAILGLALAFLSWPIAMTQTFESPLARYLGAALFDMRSEASAFVDAAVVPYLGVFIVGMALSKASHALLVHGEFRRVAKRLAITGGLALCVVALALMTWFTLKHLDLTSMDPELSALARKALDPRSKLPPGPAYLLFYGGCGLLMTAWCLLAKPRVLMGPFVEWASTIGRASLMCFILQDWLLKLVPHLFRFDEVASITFWLVYFCGTVAIVHWVASRWDAHRANRFLTLGLKRLVSG
jgi:hypothetical protein